MKRRPRILLITYLPPTRGGIATWAGIVHECCRDTKYTFLFLDILGGRSSACFSLGTKALLAARLILRLIHHLLYNRPAIVHINCCLSPVGIWRDLLMAQVISTCRVPLIVHYRGSLPDVLAYFPVQSRFALKQLIKLANVNIGMTGGSVSLLTRLSKRDHTYYLPNFIEDEWLHLSTYKKIEEQWSRPRARVQAIYVSRVSQDKGALDLLRIAEALPHIDFLLIGEIQKEIKTAIKAAPRNVTAIGEIPRRQVIERLFLGDVFVFPSRRLIEGFPNAVLEAMAAGLPIVSTRVGSVEEMIEEGRGGWLVPPDDVHALTEAIDRLAADRALRSRMGIYNRQICLEKFTFSVVFQSLSAIYDGLTQEPTRKASGVLSKLPSEDQTSPRSSKQVKNR
jgi:glycosyltransferase involved in cell wall biosynthesis